MGVLNELGKTFSDLSRVHPGQPSFLYKGYQMFFQGEGGAKEVKEPEL